MPAAISVGNAAVPGKTNPGSITTAIGSTAVATASTTILDCTAAFLTIASWTISCPSTAAASIWVAYGVAAVVGQGIEMPPGSFLFENVFFGVVHGISAGTGAVTVGWQKL